MKTTIPSDDFKDNLSDIQIIIGIEEIPNELVVSWDHTGINYVPSW